MNTVTLADGTVRADAWIDKLLESGHRCPACGSRDLETVQCNVAERVGCRPIAVDHPELGSEWCNTWLEGGDFATDIMLGTVHVSCFSCGFLLWDIRTELQKAVAELRGRAP